MNCHRQVSHNLHKIFVLRALISLILSTCQSKDELKDELISFINRLHLHIQKNSINLEINDDTVDKALRVIGREDLA